MPRRFFVEHPGGEQRATSVTLLNNAMQFTAMMHTTPHHDRLSEIGMKAVVNGHL
jgi:hypothetical protein